MGEKKNVKCVCKKCGKEFTAPKAYELCYDCSNEVVETRKCRQCGKEFKIKLGESVFYEKTGLKLPNRCPECRKEHKVRPKKIN